MKSLKYIGVAGLLLFSTISCQDETETGKLKEELVRYQDEAMLHEDEVKELTTKMKDIGEMLDQIDVSQDDVTSGLQEGKQLDYSSKLEAINNQISNSKLQIDALEKKLASSDAKKKLYSGLIKQLRVSVEEKEKVIAGLSETIEMMKTENVELKDLVSVQESQIKLKAEEIARKELELEALEQKLTTLKAEAIQAEANAYYAQGVSQLELAKKTKLAPKKKKVYLTEGLELFKKSYSLGNTEAKAKIDEIEAEL